ncbi:MAG: TIGR04086 family membrane protein [Clostridium sp.]|nr:TIGR04086 family membrane protein [Clostridium sp.]
MSIGRKFSIVIKGLILSYAVTGILLAGLAFLVYQFQLTESVADIAIIAIYVIVTFLGAFIIGKKVKEQKFLWGLLMGFLYILIISAVAMIIGEAFQVVSTANLTTAALCIGGGLLGGMLS